MTKLDRLVQLNAKVKNLVELERYDDYYDDEDHLVRNSMIGAGAVGVGGLGYLYRNQIGAGYERAKGFAKASGAAAQDIYGTAKTNISAAANKSDALRKLKIAYKKGAGRSGGSVLRGVRGVARAITGGRSKYVGLSKQEKLIQLNATAKQLSLEAK